MTRVKDLIEIISPVGSDSITVDVDGASGKRISLGSMLVSVKSGAGGRNLTTGCDHNVTDGLVATTVNIGGDPSFPNKIGAQSKPIGTDGTNAAEWGDDVAYVAGSAGVSTNVGGYDNVNNQIAGFISGGGHNFLQANVNGHSLISGGSYNWISGYRSSIVGGRDNKIEGALVGFSVICGGDNNHIMGEASYSAILCGAGNEINSTGDFNFQQGSQLSVQGAVQFAVQIGFNHYNDGSDRSIQIGGFDHIATGGNDNAAIGGSSSVLSGVGSVVLGGSGNDDNGNSAVVLSGRDARGVNSYGAVIQGAGQRVQNGDSQGVRVVQKVTTTGAAANPSATEFLELDDAKVTVISGHVFVTSYNETDGVEAAFELDFCLFWDGAVLRINGTAAEKALNAIYNPSGMSAPLLAGNTGSLRVRFGALAGKTINHVAVIDCAMTQT